MKIVLLVVFFVALTVAQGPSSTWFRVANHLGTSLPNALKFKSCGLANSVYVNAKDSGRMGFGYDVPSIANPDSYSMCSDGCADKRVPAFKDQEERDYGDEDAIYAQDSAVNFMIYWSSDYSVSDKIFTRISNGDVAYQLGANSALSVSNADESGQYLTVGSSTVRRYPNANFQFLSDNHVVTQNWYYEQANPEFACTQDAGTNNDMVTVFPAGPSGTAYKTRVMFTFADDADTTADGVVSVSVIENAGNLEQHIRTLSGANTKGNPWITNIAVLVTDSDGNIYINSSTAGAGTAPGATGSYAQSCSDVALNPTALKRAVLPLAGLKRAVLPLAGLKRAVLPLAGSS